MEIFFVGHFLSNSLEIQIVVAHCLKKEFFPHARCATHEGSGTLFFELGRVSGKLFYIFFYKILRK